MLRPQQGSGSFTEAAFVLKLLAYLAVLQTSKAKKKKKKTHPKFIN